MLIQKKKRNLLAQDHYDYGMRAVKSVITAAGNLKRAYPDENEDVLLLRGLRDINVPKFLTQDLPLFAGIITDLFPGVMPPEIMYDDLLDALARCCLKDFIQPVKTFTDKVAAIVLSIALKINIFYWTPPTISKDALYLLTDLWVLVFIRN